MSKRVLLVESDAALAEHVVAHGRAHGVSVAAVADLPQAVARARLGRPDLVVVSNVATGDPLVVAQGLRAVRGLADVPALVRTEKGLVLQPDGRLVTESCDIDALMHIVIQRVAGATSLAPAAIEIADDDIQLVEEPRALAGGVARGASVVAGSMRPRPSMPSTASASVSSGASTNGGASSPDVLSGGSRTQSSVQPVFRVPLPPGGAPPSRGSGSLPAQGRPSSPGMPAAVPPPPPPIAATRGSGSLPAQGRISNPGVPATTTVTASALPGLNSSQPSLETVSLRRENTELRTRVAELRAELTAEHDRSRSLEAALDAAKREREESDGAWKVWVTQAEAAATDAWHEREQTLERCSVLELELKQARENVDEHEARFVGAQVGTLVRRAELEDAIRECEQRLGRAVDELLSARAEANELTREVQFLVKEMARAKAG